LPTNRQIDQWSMFVTMDKVYRVLKLLSVRAAWNPLPCWASPCFRCCLEPPSFLSFTPQTVQRKHVNSLDPLGCNPVVGEKKNKAMVMFYLLISDICKDKSKLVTFE